MKGEEMEEEERKERKRREGRKEIGETAHLMPGG